MWNFKIDEIRLKPYVLKVSEEENAYNADTTTTTSCYYGNNF